MPQNNVSTVQLNAYQLSISAQNQPAVLERILQVTRYRGFTVTHFAMTPDGDEKLAITLGVQSEHAIELLQHQLNKLVNVLQVQVCQVS